MLRIPAGVDSPKLLRLLVIERQRHKPFQKTFISGLLMLKLPQRFGMLHNIFDGMRPKVPTRPVFKMEAKCVVFVIAHDGHSLIIIHHVPHDAECFGYLRPPVDIIPQENYFSFRMSVAAILFVVPKLAQQRFEALCIAMNIPYKIVHTALG